MFYRDLHEHERLDAIIENTAAKKRMQIEE